ncbi:MAG TPA: HpaII family restriction endonuclease [bacterium]|nr:HpaII family restriction endonuclease [bacterium]
MLTGNKGEWSELYVLISLLATGRLYQSDMNLNRNENDYYEIVEGYKKERNYNLSFSRAEGTVSIYKIIGEQNELIETIPINQLVDLSNTLYNGILAGSGRSFRINSVEDFLQRIEVVTVKGRSSEKADIKLRIYDHRLAREEDLGFSIKSLIGGQSTLFNPGPGTNFIFDVISNNHFDSNSFNRETYSNNSSVSKISNRIRRLLDDGNRLQFNSVQSDQLWKNLKMIDGNLPEIMAFALYYRYLHRTTALIDVVNLLEENDPLGFYGRGRSEQRFYEYKVTRFLTECAMGMTAENVWMGEYDRFGGVIVAKHDGDVVVFHIYDFNLLRKYLINNTAFEQASTGEDEERPGNPKVGRNVKKYYYGWIFEEDNGNKKMKINLQIRFR